MGRPAYSRQLVSTLTREVGLDGSGRLLDVGCGPGILTVELAPKFQEAVGLDPDPAMLAEGAHRAAEGSLPNIRWVRDVAEEIPELKLGPFSARDLRSVIPLDRLRRGLGSGLRPPGTGLRPRDHRQPGRGPTATARARLSADPARRDPRAHQRLSRTAPQSRSRLRVVVERTARGSSGPNAFREAEGGVRAGPGRHRPGRRRRPRELLLDLICCAPPVGGSTAGVRSRPAEAVPAPIPDRPVLGLARRHRDVAGRADPRHLRSASATHSRPVGPHHRAPRSTSRPRPSGCVFTPRPVSHPETSVLALFRCQVPVDDHRVRVAPNLDRHV